MGTALYGTQWQSDLARALNVDSRRVRQWLKEERPIPDWLDDELKVLLNEKSACVNHYYKKRWA
nr:transcriptional regulator [Moraxella bovis]